ncbi:sulfotransferase [Prosthecomicrobium hirschii]|uniref:sulfotransferase n=1 Tax=Prosthecodimorpha hirschii TaxID=665126 RepID=UPI00221F50BF|nr:sulfotransferase [Prosthecomicrobium hirschii]MCW1840764.1 sulfotransferase [Prosthecomicrobium hirschii]
MSGIVLPEAPEDLSEAPPAMLAELDEPVRIAMWSGPRNISTAMMRSFGNRFDTAAVDEPFYAAYLAHTGLDHPMREEVLASQSRDWRQVVNQLIGPVPDEKPVFYQKHMTHHMLPEFGRGWIDQVKSAFLIRAPESVLASYVDKRAEVTLRDIGFVEQFEIFEQVAERLGEAPPVVDAADILADPRRTLAALCDALAIPFRDEMLAWPPGRRREDGVWAPVWYQAVEASTGFGPPRGPVSFDALADPLKPIATVARTYYEKMRAYRL